MGMQPLHRNSSRNFSLSFQRNSSSHFEFSQTHNVTFNWMKLNFSLSFQRSSSGHFDFYQTLNVRMWKTYSQWNQGLIFWYSSCEMLKFGGFWFWKILSAAAGSHILWLEVQNFEAALKIWFKTSKYFETRSEQRKGWKSSNSRLR